MNRQLILFIYTISGITYHSLWDLNTKTCIFETSDLCDNPEDAIIGRDLIDGYDIKYYIDLGMRYRSRGYEYVNIQEVYIPQDCEDLDRYMKNYIETYGTKI